MEYYSAIKKNEIMSFVATWIDLEIVIEETRQALAHSIANQMKRNYLEWSGNVVNDQQIIDDLKAMSHGRLVLPDDTKLNGTGEILSKPVLSQKQGGTNGGKKKKKKQSNLKADMNNPNNPAYKKRKLQ